MPTPAPRRTYEQSCAELQRLGFIETDEVPPMPIRQPRHDDPEPLGVSFFCTQVTGDLSNMTLPRSVFGKSEVSDVSFRNTDLSESTLCWCDFVDVDFSDASLRAGDLRSASFDRVNFSKCDLRDADLRRSIFKNCEFGGALVKGMKLTRAQAGQVELHRLQGQDVDWQSNEGDEPGGG